MEWIILFIVSSIVFFILSDWKMLYLNAWSGIVGCLLQIYLDYIVAIHGNYLIKDPVIPILDSSLLFLIGPVFMMGTLLAQYTFKKRWANLLNVLVMSTLLTTEEYLFVLRRKLIYLNWDISHSILVNLMAIASLSWFSLVVLNKGGYHSK